MSAKYICGMLAGLAVGTAVGISAKCVMEKTDTCKAKKKAKKIVQKVEKYISDAIDE